ncbi:MAG TPA: methyltransferase domain-containing protein [Chitinophagaceae bacterium]|nr:methyltransferase domain-containing protein [Chitinophagaceae bacterium]
MFDAFPKTRPWVDKKKLQKLYENYEQNRLRKTTASRLAGFVEGWMHKKVAADVKNDSTKSTLEIGAGSLNHLAYENGKVYDIIEPWKKLWIDSPWLGRVGNKYDNIRELPSTTLYDRIISIATFEHILDLPDLIAHTCLHLSDKGCLRVAIPNEGSFVWTLCWRVTTGLEYFLKTGEDYGLIMKYEHVNTANEIEQILKYFYGDVKKNVFGLSHTLAIYCFYECLFPKIEKASTFIDRYEY